MKPKAPFQPNQLKCLFLFWLWGTSDVLQKAQLERGMPPLRGLNQTFQTVSHQESMSHFIKQYLILVGVAAIACALLHVAIPIGGPEWYAFFGAPKGLVQMARSGNVRAPVTCLGIAVILFTCAAYAFSGAGVVRRLPFLRTVLALIASVFLLRGVLLIPLILWRPGILVRVCDCHYVDTFMVVTSIVCLVMGLGYAVGAMFQGSSRQ